MKQRPIATLVLIACCLTVPVSALAIDGTPTWFRSQVAAADPTRKISSPILAFDHHGTPSVAWSSLANGAGGNTVFRSELLGLDIWAHQEIDSGPTTGLQTALSFDRAERPTVAWVNLGGDLQARFDGGTIQPIALAGANFDAPVIRITHDLAGNLRGIYSGDTPGNLFDIRESGGAYSTTGVATLPDVLELNDAMFTTDRSGLGHVIARTTLSTGGQSVTLVSEPSFGGSWPSNVLATADAVNGVGIATDPADGNPAISYTTFDTATNTSKLFYAKFNGFALETTEILSSTTNVFQDVSLAFDLADGLPAIAFEQQVVAAAAEQLLFTYLDSGSLWQTGMVDDSISIDSPQTGFLRGPSLAFDDFGTSFPAIAYVDGDDSLAVSFDPPAVPEPATIGFIIVALAGLPRRRRL